MVLKKVPARRPAAARALKPSCNPIDVLVGGRLRMRRVLLGVSQDDLGRALRVPVAQVQRFEDGSRRIGADRLLELSRLLEAPPAFFFEGFPHAEHPDGERAKDPGRPVTAREGLQINRIFTHIKDPEVRRGIAELLLAITAGAS